MQNAEGQEEVAVIEDSPEVEDKEQDNAPNIPIM
jgi:hypothetical protein